MHGIIDDLRAQWNDAIARYRQAKADLDNNESQLYAVHEMAAADPVDLKEWQAQFNAVNAIKSTIDSLEHMASIVSNAWGALTGAFGLSGRQLRRQGALGAVGIAPLIPAGITVAAFLALVWRVAAIAASLGAFVMYMVNKNDKATWIGSRTDALIAVGVDPEKASTIARKEATDAASTETGYQFITGLKGAITLALITLGVLFVLPQLKALAK
jgi:hypothetical protein